MIEYREVARLQEACVARTLAELADECAPIAGGVMGRSGPGSCFTSAAGLGIGCPVTPDDIARVIDFHVAAGSEPRIEACPFADPSLLTALEAHAFVVRQWELVLFRVLDGSSRVRPLYDPPQELEIRPVDPTDPAAIEAYALRSVAGFFPEGETPPEVHVRAAMASATHAAMRCYTASIGGEPVADGAMGLYGDVAGLFGATTVHRWRRRGIQQALIARRLNDAAAAGARLAVVGSRPGSPTERNVRRMGFECAYIKSIMVKPIPGLTPASP